MLVAFTVAAELIHSLRGPIEALGRRDRGLADQVRRAGTSIVLNIAEGERREGLDRLHHYRIGAGSAAEVRAALLVAGALGYIADDKLSTARTLLDRELGLLWGLTHGKR